jgi:hypothetical protein
VKAVKLVFWMGAGVLSVAAHCGTFAEYEALEKAAKTGDYQAQRNVAYWLSGGYDGSPPLNPVLACAWRIVILESGSTSVDPGDVSNKKLYCDKRLDADGLKAAQAQARTLQKSVPRAKR